MPLIRKEREGAVKGANVQITIYDKVDRNCYPGVWWSASQKTCRNNNTAISSAKPCHGLFSH